MSAKKLNRKQIDRSESSRYFDSGEDFYAGAQSALRTENFSAAAVLIVHAAIAYTDAITIKFGGVKNSGGEHSSALELVRQLLKLADVDERALNRCGRLIAEKSKASYTAAPYSLGKANDLLKDLERYREWVLEKLK